MNERSAGVSPMVLRVSVKYTSSDVKAQNLNHRAICIPSHFYFYAKKVSLLRRLARSHSGENLPFRLPSAVSAKRRICLSRVV